MKRFPDNEIIKLIGETPRYDLGSSTGPNLFVNDLAPGALGEVELGYRSAAGSPELRAHIATVHGVSTDDVVVTAGGMHALFLIAFILCERGDEAIITTPVFPPARAALDGIGASVREVAVSFDRGYQLDVNALATLLSAQTKLVSLASPQNPSGVEIPITVLSDVVTLMRERSPQAYLLIDDTYREAAHGDKPVAPSALALDPRVVTVASLSKCHGAPGLRLGWAITRDPALRDQLILGKFNTIVSSPAIEEQLGIRVFEQRERIIAERRRLLAAGVARTEQFVNENAEFVEWVQPDASAICCVRLKREIFDESAVVEFYHALERASVRVSSGAWFGEEARVFRLGYGHLPLVDLDEALRALSGALRNAATPRSSSFA